jgi:hypothetical protein
MAGLARVYRIDELDIDVSGNSRYIVRYYLCDPELQGDGSGHDARFTFCIVTLNVNSPFTFEDEIKAAVIADAAAQPQPFTVSNFRSIIPVWGNQLLIDDYNYNVPVSGFNITIGNNVNGLLLDPAGTLATGTITMPGNPRDGRIVKISSTQIVNTLTLSPNSGQSFSAGSAITSLAVNSPVSYIYRNSSNTWYRWT